VTLGWRVVICGRRTEVRQWQPAGMEIEEPYDMPYGETCSQLTKNESCGLPASSDRRALGPAGKSAGATPIRIA
jgi:hypothetical protein